MIVSRRVLFAGASALVVAGCADVVGPPPAPKLFTLTPPLVGAAPGPKVAWTLVIQLPEASAGLDSERIAITRPPAGLDFFADAAWADRLPRLVEAGMVEAFEGSARIASVARDSDGARADYFLITDVREFACRYDAGDGAPLAVVKIGARVVDAKSRKIAGTAVFAKEVRASANSVPAGVAALASAYGAVLAELVPWVLDRGLPVG
jgi:cholesterol transport system auxiliary component